MESGKRSEIDHIAGTPRPAAAQPSPGPMAVPTILLELAVDGMLGLTEDGAAVRVLVTPAPDATYLAASGTSLNVHGGLVETLAPVPRGAGHYQPSP